METTLDAIAQASADVANALLTIANFDEAVNTALQIIGEVLDTDRINVIENFDSSSDSVFPSWRALGYEWNSPGTVPQYLDPNATQGSYEEIPDIFEPLHQGQTVSFLIEEMSEPFRSTQMAIGVKATHVIPILVEGQWWGVLGLDDCRAAKMRSTAELSVLKIAADCIGSAIQRQQTQQSLLQAEQNRVVELATVNEGLHQRDRLLSTVAAIMKDLLENPQTEMAIAQALQRIGEATGISRIVLLQEKIDFNNGRLQHQVIQEWSIPGVQRQSDDPSTRVVYNEDYGNFVDDLHAGRSIWYSLENLPEPARIQEAGLGVKSTGAAPIFIEGNYFGCIGFDDCVNYRQWTTYEIDMLTSGAGAIGAALYRQQLGDRLIAAVLEERSRFARDMHDTLAQAFTGVLMQLEAAKRKITTAQPEAAQDHIARARSLALEGLSEARRSVQALRPEMLESLDLPTALRRLAQQTTADTNLTVTAQIEGTPHALPPDLETNLLRIGQEALTNALRHGRAQKLRLELLFEPDVIHLYVIDDGQGFDPKSHRIGNGFGLIGMQERSQRLGGQFTLKSSPGQGTVITVTIPLPSQTNGAT